WGAVVLLLTALLVEYSDRRRSQPGVAWRGFYVAVTLALGLVLWYVKPFRDPVNGPLLAVGATDGRVALVRLDIQERPFSTIPASCDNLTSLDFGADRKALYGACAQDSKVSIVDLLHKRESGAFQS